MVEYIIENKLHINCLQQKGEYEMSNTDNQIITKRLILRKFKKADYDEYCNILGNDEVSKWLGTGKKIDAQKVKKMMSNFKAHWSDRGYGVWAVVEKQSNKLIGHCGLNYFKDLDKTELLYAFDEKYWGRGYATESAKAVVEYTRENLTLSKLTAIAYPENIGSRKVIEKAGFTYMGNREFFGTNLAYYELQN